MTTNQPCTCGLVNVISMDDVQLVGTTVYVHGLHHCYSYPVRKHILIDKVKSLP